MAMLIVSDAMFASAQQGAVDDLLPKIDRWLTSNLPYWRTAPSDQRHRTLHAVLKDARDVGMEVETDFALYALLMLERGPDWRSLRAEAHIDKALRDHRLNARSKLLYVEDLSASRCDAG